MKAQFTLGNKIFNKDEKKRYEEFGFEFANVTTLLPHMQFHHTETDETDVYRQKGDDIVMGVQRMRDFQEYLESYGRYVVDTPDGPEADIKIMFI